MANWAVDQLEDIRELQPVDECPIRPVRHHFGITSFGVNAWTAQAAGDRLINEHEEDPGNEELYIVTRGRAIFELDGERREATEGTFIFAAPNVKRTAFAEEAGTTVVAVGATAGKVYEPVGWELWYPLRKKYESGNYADVVPQLREVVAEAPQYGLLFYNLAFWKASPARNQKRSHTCERRSSCPSSSGRTHDRIQISMQFATILP
jgi:hypothetical protein